MTFLLRLIGAAFVTLMLARMALLLPRPWDRRIYLVVTWPFAVVCVFCSLVGESGFAALNRNEPRV
jgi:hypothetical protein